MPKHDAYAHSPGTEDNLPLCTCRILLSKLDPRRDQISSCIFLALEEDPRDGRGDEHVEVLAPACLLEVLLRSATPSSDLGRSVGKVGVPRRMNVYSSLGRQSTYPSTRRCPAITRSASTQRNARGCSMCGYVHLLESVRVRRSE